MTLHTDRWPTGTPAWADLMVPDLEPVRRFYAAVLGWTYEEAPAPDGTTYLMASVGGRYAAALGDVLPEPDHPAPEWTVYLAADDLVATVQAVEAAGGAVVVPPMDAGDSGAFAVLADPAGAVFGLWRSGMLTGFDVVDEPGAMTWCETMSRDPEAARSFYATVFGYTYTDHSAPGFTYAAFTVDGRLAGGIGGLPADRSGAEPHWLVYFRVEDVDDAVAAVVRHGGTMTEEPWDSAFGRVAVVAGPVGETFALHAELEAAVVESQASADPA
jgi:uncharacterized protein